MTTKAILVVDEDQNILEAFKDFLKKEHLHMIASTSLKEAQQLLRDKEVDLLILNIGLDEISSIKFLETKQKISPSLPVIVISAFPELLYNWDLTAYGVDHFFQKPFDIAEIRKVIKDLLIGRSPLNKQLNN